MSWRRIPARGPKGARVYTREQHHNVLEAWREEALAGGPLVLVSFDYHTDTLPVFNTESKRALRTELGREPTSEERDQRCMLSHTSVDWSSDKAFHQAMARMRHDEHIDAAQKCGYISKAFLLLGCTEPGYVPPWLTLLMPVAQNEEGDPLPVKAMCDALLEDVGLGPQVQQIEQVIGTKLSATRFVLDIDLDFFRTLRGAQPQHHQVFHQLVRDAAFITIALEPGCVGMLRLPGEDIVSEDLQRAVDVLIASAFAKS